MGIMKSQPYFFIPIAMPTNEEVGAERRPLREERDARQASRKREGGANGTREGRQWPGLRCASPCGLTPRAVRDPARRAHTGSRPTLTERHTPCHPRQWPPHTPLPAHAHLSLSLSLPPPLIRRRSPKSCYEVNDACDRVGTLVTRNRAYGA